MGRVKFRTFDNGDGTKSIWGEPSCVLGEAIYFPRELNGKKIVAAMVSFYTNANSEDNITFGDKDKPNTWNLHGKTTSSSIRWRDGGPYSPSLDYGGARNGHLFVIVYKD